MKAWIAVQKQYFTGITISIATGGNIRKLAKKAKKAALSLKN
jgi:hypothetical protein